jgi:hypothetical protein
LRTVANEIPLGVKTFTALAASHEMAIAWVNKGAQFGILGRITGPSQLLERGEYRMNTQFGFLTKTQDSPVNGFGRFLITMLLEGVKNFGIESWWRG